MTRKDRFEKIKDKGRKEHNGKVGGGARKLELWQKLALAATALFTLIFIVNILNIFLADVSFNLGESAARYGFYESAGGHYGDAVQLNPREPRYHRELAWVYANRGNQESAVNEAETAYQLNPKNSLTLRSIITTYKVLAKDNPEYQKRAEELIQDAVNQQPTNPELYLEQAKIFLPAEKGAEARASLEKALKLKEDYAEARELLQTLPQNPN